MCNRPCVYRQTGSDCSCEENDWPEDLANDRAESPLEVQVATPEPKDNPLLDEFRYAKDGNAVEDRKG